MRRTALVTALLVLGVGAVVLARPWLTDSRRIVAVTPQPPPLFAVYEMRLAPGSQACMNEAALDRRSEEAHLVVNRSGSGPVPLELTINAPGYRARALAPPRYRDGNDIVVPVHPPSQSLLAVICVRNRGNHAVRLLASGDRTRSRSGVTVDGRVVPLGFVISFYERAPSTVLQALPDSLERMTVLRAFFVVPATLWALMALLVIGVPAAMVWAYVRSLAEDVTTDAGSTP
jgi:hypothetical protein